MNKLSRISTMIGTSIIALGSFQSCVDDDYDLSKDMNLVVNVGGGQLSVPGSSTELFSLEKLLDLDPESSIKAADQALADKYGLAVGDYLLVQSGDPTSSNFKIDPIHINLDGGAHAESTVSFPAIPADLPIPVNSVSVTLGAQSNLDEFNLGIGAFENIIDLHENNVTEEVVSLTHVATDINMTLFIQFTIPGYSELVTINEGFQINLGPNFEVELGANYPAGCRIVKEGNDNIVRFTSDVAVSNEGCELDLHVTGIDLKDTDVFDANHNFNFTNKIVTTGKLSLAVVAGGPAINMTIITNVGSASGEITSVSGIVNPVINPETFSFEINDIPDFLKEDGNTLDIANPQIYLTITNPTQAKVKVSIQLTPIIDGSAVAANKVDINDIVLVPGENKIVICRQDKNIATGYTVKEVGNLNNLIMTIPNRIEGEITASVVQETTTFALGTDYNVRAENEVIAPLAFGNNLSFTYSDTEEGWDTDLGKYDFNEARIEMEVSNTAPLNFNLEATPIYTTGGSRDGVKITIEKGAIAAGTLANPSVSQVVISLKGNGNSFTSTNSSSSLNGLDGIEYKLVTNNNEEVAGIPINEGQGMKFTEIRARLIGGVTVDLNEL